MSNVSRVYTLRFIENTIWTSSLHINFAAGRESLLRKGLKLCSVHHFGPIRDVLYKSPSIVLPYTVKSADNSENLTVAALVGIKPKTLNKGARLFSARLYMLTNLVHIQFHFNLTNYISSKVAQGYRKEQKTYIHVPTSRPGLFLKAKCLLFI